MIANDARDVGILVRQARRRAGMTQARLAQLIGTTRQWVISFEKGSSDARLDMVIRAIRAVDLDIDLVDAGHDLFAGVFASE